MKLYREYKGYTIKKNIACEHYEILDGTKKAYHTTDGKHIGALRTFARLKDAKEFIDNNNFDRVIFK